MDSFYQTLEWGLLLVSMVTVMSDIMELYTLALKRILLSIQSFIYIILISRIYNVDLISKSAVLWYVINQLIHVSDLQPVLWNFIFDVLCFRDGGFFHDAYYGISGGPAACLCLWECVCHS